MHRLVNVTIVRRSVIAGLIFIGATSVLMLTFGAWVSWGFDSWTDRGFFERVEHGYKTIAAAEPRRVCVIDSTQPLEVVKAAVWQRVEPLLPEAQTG